MSRFGELLGGKKAEPAPAPAPEPVVEEVVEASSPEPVVEEELTAEESSGEVFLESMSKRELEEYGRTVGIELDRRHSRSKLIQELEEHLSNS